MYREKWVELIETGWKNATVVNLAPWQLYCSGVLAPIRELRIPHVPRDKEIWDKASKITLSNGAEIPFRSHLFDRPEVTILEQVHGFEGSFSGSTSSQVTMPLRFAADVVQQNNTPVCRGGVFFYVGGHALLSNPETAEAEREQLEQAHAELIMYCNQLLEEGNAAYAEKNRNKISEIQKYHRWAVRYLRLLGLLPEDPEWLTQSVKIGKPVTQHCDQCGSEVLAEAARCLKCNYILKPFVAFDKLMIDLETPGAKLVLRRMTHEEIAKLIENGRFLIEDLEAINVNPLKHKGKKDKQGAEAKG